MAYADHGMVDKAGKTIRRKQIRPALVTAIKLIVEEGYSVRDAAISVGYQFHSLEQALVKPHVKAFRAGVKRAWLEGRTQKAWLNIAELADGAKSEDVKMKANKVFLEAAGELGQTDRGDARPTTLIQIVAQAGSTVAVPTSGLIEPPDDDALEADYTLVDIE